MTNYSHEKEQKGFAAENVEIFVFDKERYNKVYKYMRIYLWSASTLQILDADYAD